jgi:hypothetical protein
MAMSTGSKVALGVGITLALAGVGVGLYFVFRKPKTEAQQAADILSAQKPPVTLSELQRQNPNMSNAELLKALGTLLKSGSRIQGGGGSGGGAGIGSGGGLGSGLFGKKQQTQTGAGYNYGQPSSGYDYTASNAYNQDTNYGASYSAGSYSSASYGYSAGGADYSGGAYSGGGSYSGGGY